MANHGAPKERRLTKGQVWFLMVAITLVVMLVVGVVSNAVTPTGVCTP